MQIVYLNRTSNLPKGELKGSGPMTIQEAIDWARKQDAPVLYWWGPNQTAFICEPSLDPAHGDQLFMSEFPIQVIAVSERSTRD